MSAKHKKRSWLYIIMFFSFVAAMPGCSTRYIEGTKIEDSDEARDVIRTIETYRKAMERRDADMLVALASKNYFEKNGDSSSQNNYDYEGLITFLRSPEFRKVTACRLTIYYKRIDFNEAYDVATAHYHYTSEFKLPPPEYEDADVVAVEPEETEREDNFDEEIWHHKNDDNEMVLELENERWYILKGM